MGQLMQQTHWQAAQQVQAALRAAVLLPGVRFHLHNTAQPSTSEQAQEIRNCLDVDSVVTLVVTVVVTLAVTLAVTLVVTLAVTLAVHCHLGKGLRVINSYLHRASSGCLQMGVYCILMGPALGSGRVVLA